MNLISELLMLLGGLVGLLAGIGLLRFDTSYARFHAAGKASPVAYMVAAVGAGLTLGAAGSVLLAIAAVAMVLTLPLGVHILFRAVYRTTGAKPTATSVE